MKLELEIVDLLARNKEKNFSINEIAKTLGAYYSFVHKTVNKLTKDKVIKKSKAGKSHLCSLNLDNEKTATLIQMGEIEKREKFYNANKELKLILDDFVKSALDCNNISAIVLFGSYSKGIAMKESDIDILIISRGKIDVEKITKEIYAKYGKEINAIILTQNDFKKQKNEPAIKELIKDHHVLYGAENFVSMVFRK